MNDVAQRPLHDRQSWTVGAVVLTVLLSLLAGDAVRVGEESTTIWQDAQGRDLAKASFAADNTAVVGSPETTTDPAGDGDAVDGVDLPARNSDSHDHDPGGGEPEPTGLAEFDSDGPGPPVVGNEAAASDPGLDPSWWPHGTVAPADPASLQHPPVAQLPAPAPEYCLSYDPAKLYIHKQSDRHYVLNDVKPKEWYEKLAGTLFPKWDPTGWTWRHLEFRFTTWQDAEDARLIMRQWRTVCFIGHEHHKINRWSHHVYQYFRDPSGLATRLPSGRDCIAYERQQLDLYQYGDYWLLAHGTRVLPMPMDSQAAAERALHVARSSTALCFVARDREFGMTYFAPPRGPHCWSYDPDRLYIEGYQHREYGYVAALQTWIGPTPPHGSAWAPLAFFATYDDAKRAREIARNWTELCHIGWDNDRSPQVRDRFVHQYFRSPAPRPRPLPVDRCQAYDPADLRAWQDRTSLAAWHLGDLPLLFHDQTDAALAQQVARSHRHLCTIGGEPYPLRLTYWLP